MRYLIGFICVCALVGTSPLSASAQGNQGTEQEPASNLEWLEWSDLQWLQWLLQVQQRFDPEPATWSPPLSEGSWLRLELGFAGVRVVPMPPLGTYDRYSSDPYTPELEAIELRVKSAKIGYGVSVVVSGVGFVMGMAAFIGYYSSCGIVWEEPCYSPSWVAPVGWMGVALMSGGVVGMITSGILMRRRKRERDSLKYGRPHRVQWDLAQSRLVF